MPSAMERYNQARHSALESFWSPDRITTYEWTTKFRPQLQAGRDLTDDVIAALRADAMTPAFAAVRSRILNWIASEAPKYRPDASTPTTGIALNPPAAHDAVYIAPSGVLTTSPAGTAPATTLELISALHRAGQWVNQKFDRRTSTFAQLPGLSNDMKRGLAEQLVEALGSAGLELQPDQRDDLLGSAGAVGFELLKALPNQGLQAATHAALFEALCTMCAAPKTPRSIAAFLAPRFEEHGVRASLTAAQRTRALEVVGRFIPKDPFDFPALEARAAAAKREGKPLVLDADMAFGAGEGFLEGYAVALEKGDQHDNPLRGVKWTRDSGAMPGGPCVYVATVQPGQHGSKWDVPVQLRLTLRYSDSNKFDGMRREEVVLHSQHGHSNLGNDTPKSLANAPDMKGAKLVIMDKCCTADRADDVYDRYPDAIIVVSQASTYFRTTEHPQYGKIAHQSEGFQADMVALDNLLKKGDMLAFDQGLEKKANWWGHPAGVKNNWITSVSRARLQRERDADNDGISDRFDPGPSYNTAEVAADTAREFDLTLPQLPAGNIRGDRPFLAVASLNTFVGYNPTLEALGNRRELVGATPGIWFEPTPDKTEYVRFTRLPDDEGQPVVAVSFNKALADMSIDALRAVVALEYVMWVGREGRVSLTKTQQKLMAAVLAAGMLEFDKGWRDREIFDGLKRLYNLPAELGFQAVHSAYMKAEAGRSNYGGDLQAVRDLQAALSPAARQALERDDVGAPALPIPTTHVA